MDEANSIGTFKNIAEGIFDKYQVKVRQMTAEAGVRPSFDDLMTQLKKMEQELTGQGVKFIEKHKHTHADPTALTDSLRSIIRSTIENFVRQL